MAVWIALLAVFVALLPAVALQLKKQRAARDAARKQDDEQPRG